MKYVDKNYRHKHLGFKGLSLTCFNLETGLRLIQDEEHKHMYWIVRDNDFKSKNFYNLINARENCRILFLTHMNSDEPDINAVILPWASQEGTDALFCRRS